jgi:hypothetical protein
MLLTSPVIVGGMENRFEIVRQDAFIPVGSIAERIVGRVAIKKFAMHNGARKAAEGQPVEGRGP